MALRVPFDQRCKQWFKKVDNDARRVFRTAFCCDVIDTIKHVAEFEVPPPRYLDDIVAVRGSLLSVNVSRGGHIGLADERRAIENCLLEHAAANSLYMKEIGASRRHIANPRVHTCHYSSSPADHAKCASVRVCGRKAGDCDVETDVAMMVDVDFHLPIEDIVECVPKTGLPLWIVTPIVFPGEKKHFMNGAFTTGGRENLQTIVRDGPTYAHKHHDWDNEGTIMGRGGRICAYRNCYVGKLYRVVYVYETFTMSLQVTRLACVLPIIKALDHRDDTNRFYMDPPVKTRSMVLSYSGHVFDFTERSVYVVGTAIVLERSLVDTIAFKNRDARASVVTSLITGIMKKEKADMCLLEVYVCATIARIKQLGDFEAEFVPFDYSKVNFGMVYESAVDGEGNVTIDGFGSYQPFQQKVRRDRSEDGGRRDRNASDHHGQCLSISDVASCEPSGPSDTASARIECIDEPVPQPAPAAVGRCGLDPVPVVVEEVPVEQAKGVDESEGALPDWVGWVLEHYTVPEVGSGTGSTAEHIPANAVIHSDVRPVCGKRGESTQTDAVVFKGPRSRVKARQDVFRPLRRPVEVRGDRCITDGQACSPGVYIPRPPGLSACIPPRGVRPPGMP